MGIPKNRSKGARRLAQVALHSLALTVMNIASIATGFIAYHAVGAHNQIATQVPIAVVLSISLFILWAFCVGRLSRGRLVPHGGMEFAGVFIASLLWNPVVWVPLHYVTQGYLTSTGNILALLCFQAPVNAIALLAIWSIAMRQQRRIVTM